jgi:hypothetical protein
LRCLNLIEECPGVDLDSDSALAVRTGQQNGCAQLIVTAALAAETQRSGREKGPVDSARLQGIYDATHGDRFRPDEIGKCLGNRRTVCKSEAASTTYHD